MMSRIALYIRDFSAGGVQRVILDLARGLLEHGYAVDLVVNRDDGEYRQQVPAGARTIVLRRHRQSRTIHNLARALWATMPAYGSAATALPANWAASRPPLPRLVDVAALAGYLTSAQPATLVAAHTPCNLAAVWARRLAVAPTRLMLTEHVPLSQLTAKRKWRGVRRAVQHGYPPADAIVAVSDGVADDLALAAKLPRQRIRTIYNPVVPPDLAARTAAPAPHPWLATRGGPPVVVAAGRLEGQKNFPLLLDAFARLRRQRPARLLILGEGGKRPQLEAQARALGIEDDVALPGFIDNPYAAFSRAALFALSSNYEGLANVLIEALACGCPVVSTDCPHGPAEILAGGRYGELVPVGDVARLADAMARTLDHPLPAETLRARGAEFSLERSVAQYLALLAPDDKTRNGHR
jgi:glycosyltransferase involved in cell wall biosynthesis